MVYYHSCETCKNFGNYECDDLREKEYLHREDKDCYEPKININNDKYTEKRVAREILSIIEEVCFSKKYFDYRVSYGSNGQRDLIIQTIKEKYEIG